MGSTPSGSEFFLFLNRNHNRYTCFINVHNTEASPYNDSCVPRDFAVKKNLPVYIYIKNYHIAV